MENKSNQNKRVLGISEYIDKIYKGKSVTYTYKVHDTEGNKEYWKWFNNRLNRDIGDIRCEYKDKQGKGERVR